MTERPGYLISLEGLDGAGKSTQVASLAAALRATGRDVITVRPNDTRLGEWIRALVLQHQLGSAVDPWAEALLFIAGRAQLVREVIVPALERGSVVIADRFVDSTLAYQGGGRGLPIDELLHLHTVVCVDVWPQLTIYLDVPLVTAVSRQRAQQLPLDRIEVAPEQFHAAVRDAFDRLAAAYPKRIVRVDATRPAMELSRDIADVVLARLPQTALRARAAAPV